VIRIPAVVIGASLLAGCIYSEDVGTIRYDPSPSASRVEGAGAIKLAIVDGRTIDRTRISTKVGGPGMNFAAIRSATDVRDVVRDALAAELELRGFRVGSTDRVMTATIQRFYTDYDRAIVGYTAKGDVELDVTVNQPSGAAPFARSYKGVSESDIFRPNGSNAAEAVASALRDAIDKMFADPEFRQALTGSDRRGQRAE
jgi:uncharacterized lipoprotein YajG